MFKNSTNNMKQLWKKHQNKKLRKNKTNRFNNTDNSFKNSMIEACIVIWLEKKLSHM